MTEFVNRYGSGLYKLNIYEIFRSRISNNILFHTENDYMDFTCMLLNSKE